ncbi:MAG: hypothetical protein ACRES7_00915 [Gammaproteobacteria bacterium]
MDIANYGKRLLGGVAIGSMSLLTACVVQSAPPPAPALALTAAPTTAPCASCGVITSIQAIAPSDYRVSIRLDTGAMETLDQAQQPAFRVGDRVQILQRTSSP